MSVRFNTSYWVLDTKDADGTLVVGFSFIFLSYFLHPVVEVAYQKARVHNAWRAIAKRQAVEVTNYPMLQDNFGGRGTWDAPREMTFLLALFSLASWGLELSMRFPHVKGLVDPLNRSLPVELGNIDRIDVWLVGRLFGQVAQLLPL